MRGKWLSMAAILLLVIVFIGIAVTYLLYASPYARFGRNHSYDPPTFAAVRAIQERASTGQSLTSAEIAVLRSASNDGDWRIRCRALTALFYVGGTAHAVTAAEIARAKLTDKEAVVRQYALSALARMRAQDARLDARRMLNDPAANVRARAQQILKTGK